MVGTTARRLGVVGVALIGGVAVSLFGMGTSSTTPRAAAVQELDPFDDCAELRQWYVDAALPNVDAWGLQGPPIEYDVAAAEGLTDAAATRSEGDQAGAAVANGETGTNLQEAGVDEPDIAKTDGEILVTVHGRTLVVFDVTGAEPVRVGSLELGRQMWGAELLLVGDRVVVLSGTGGFYGGVLSDVRLPYPMGADRTRIMTVDVSFPWAPERVALRTLRASLVSARQYGDIVRVVTSSTPAFDFVQPHRGLSMREARLRNRQIVRASQPSDWLPQNRAGRPTVACTDVSRPNNSTAMGTIRVLTLDPIETGPDSGEVIGVAADGELVYSSTDRLYVASTDWGWSWGWGLLSGGEREPANTDIYAFALSDDATSYSAAGEVEGYVPDRWAFSEYDGDLRVASTQGNGSQSMVTVLQERGDDLVSVGSVGGLGEGEDIKAVRWFGDIAVVVTFRMIDPLYTLDLSQPRNPRLLGELKIPGFSEYLHPLGDDLLLGVGQAAGGRGFTRGSQVQTFDLDDLTSPEQVMSLRLDGEYSAVETDSRVFTYLPEQRLAFVPTGSWRGGGNVEVVRVGTDGALTFEAALAAGWPEMVRVLPLDGDRVALVSRGEVASILDVTGL